jgi:hypothetical protein
MDDLVDLFNMNNDDLEHADGPLPAGAASRRSRQVERLIVDPVMKRPHDGWTMLNTLVEGVDDRPGGALDYLGAYLVEDFVKVHGVEFLDQLEAAARGSPRWRRALSAARDWHNPRSVDPRVSARLVPYIDLHRAPSDSGDNRSGMTLRSRSDSPAPGMRRSSRGDEMAAVTESELDVVEQRLGRPLPAAYREHMTQLGAGPIATASDEYIELWTPADVLAINALPEVRELFPDLVRFGGDGSREHLAFDYRTSPPKVVLLDVTAATDEDLIEQGATFEAFMAKATVGGLDFGV